MPSRSRLRLVLVLATSGLLASACAEGPGPGSAAAAAVKERRDNYRRIGDAYKALKETVESSSPELALIARDTRVIREIGARQSELFPPGSGHASGAKTRARDAVWTEAALFARRQQDFLAAADALINTPPGETGHRFEALTQACLDCHRDFREKR